MTPTTPELLIGVLAAFAEPAPPESAGEFMAGRIGVVGMISLLAAQEAERGIATRVEENRAIRALFSRFNRNWDSALGGQLSWAARGGDGDLTLTALDAKNAELRRTLIALHAAVDTSGRPDTTPLQGELLHLLKHMAELRALHLPPMPPRS